MHAVFPPVKQSPDDLMGIPMAELIHKLDRRVLRYVRWANLMQRQGNTECREQIEEYAVREKALIHAAATALRARAGEAIRFASSVGVDCPTEMVRTAPHLCACALVKHIMGPEYGKDE